MSWHDECFRKLFFDYHTQQNAPEVGACFNGARWAQALQDAGVQGVSCIAKCGYGWKYYRRGTAGYVHPHLPQGLDMLEDTVRECHLRDIRVIAYVHTFNSEPVAAAHPEWLVRDANDEAHGINLCLMSPVVERELIPQLQEIVSLYDVDGLFLDGTFAGGICYCESCRRRFVSDTGLELPRDADDPACRTYIQWQRDAYITLRHNILTAVAAANPRVLTSINWAYTTRQPETPPDNIGFLTQDILPRNMALTASYQARHWALSGRSFDIMNHGSHKWWQEWSVKPATSLMQECALILMNGGRTWIGYQMYPWFAAEDYLLDTVRQVFTFVREREPLLRDSRPLPYAAVLHGTAQSDGHRLGALNPMVDERSLLGAHRALTLAGIPYHAVGEAELLAHLNEFKIVLIGNDQFISPELTTALEQYVRSGGSLLLMGLSGLTGKNGAFIGNPTLETMAGAAVTGGYPHSHGYMMLRKDSGIGKGVAAMPLLTTRPLCYIRPTNDRVLADALGIYLRSDGQPLYGNDNPQENLIFSPPGAPTGTAAITVHDYGRGQVAVIATDLFAAYAGNSAWSLKNLLRNLINEVLLPGRAFKITAPDYVEVALAARGDQLLVHLANLVRESPLYDDRCPPENILAEDILPIHDIVLHIPAACAPRGCTLEPGGQPLPANFADGMITVTVPRLDIHTCAVIDGYSPLH